MYKFALRSTPLDVSVSGDFPGATAGKPQPGAPPDAAPALPPVAAPPALPPEPPLAPPVPPLAPPVAPLPLLPPLPLAPALPALPPLWGFESSSLEPPQATAKNVANTAAPVAIRPMGQYPTRH